MKYLIVLLSLIAVGCNTYAMFPNAQMPNFQEMFSPNAPAYMLKVTNSSPQNVTIKVTNKQTNAVVAQKQLQPNGNVTLTQELSAGQFIVQITGGTKNQQETIDFSNAQNTPNLKSRAEIVITDNGISKSESSFSFTTK